MRKKFRLTLEDIEADDETVFNRLRLLLKIALRRFGLRNQGVKELPAEGETEVEDNGDPT